jgi:hypothetical protein
MRAIFAAVNDGVAEYNMAFLHTLPERSRVKLQQIGDAIDRIQKPIVTSHGRKRSAGFCGCWAAIAIAAEKRTPNNRPW